MPMRLAMRKAVCPRFQLSSPCVMVKLVHFIFCVVQLIGFVLLSLFSPWRFWVVCVVLAVITVYDIVLFGLMMRHTATSDYKKSTKGSPWTFEQ